MCGTRRQERRDDIGMAIGRAVGAPPVGVAATSDEARHVEQILLRKRNFQKHLFKQLS